MSTLGKAIAIAAEAHEGQVDKSGQPYILHPLRVMMAAAGGGGDGPSLMVAVLHDVLEDTDIAPSDLRKAGFSREVVESVRAISRNDGEDYFDFIWRAKANFHARYIKILDIQDNMSPARSGFPEHASMMERYGKALHILLED